MHITATGISTSVNLHSEVPFISFLRLVHFRITFTGFVFSGLWCCDQACINDSTTVHDKTGFVETAVYICKDLLANLVLFKHMAKLEQRCSVRYLLLIKIYVHKCTHGIAVVDGILDSFIG